MITGVREKQKIKNFLEFNENKSTTYPNLWVKMRPMLRKVHITKYIHKEIMRNSQLKNTLGNSRTKISKLLIIAHCMVETINKFETKRTI